MSKLSQVLAATTLAVIGAASGTAFAQEATYEYPQALSSELTRAQVQAELFQARRDGSIRVSSTTYNPLTVAKSLKSRAEVQAEVLGAGHDAAAAMLGEDSGSFALSRPASRKAATVLASR